MAPAVDPFRPGRCGRAHLPEGWWCTRDAGHDGPCAGWQLITQWRNGHACPDGVPMLHVEHDTKGKTQFWLDGPAVLRLAELTRAEGTGQDMTTMLERLVYRAGPCRLRRLWKAVKEAW